MEARQVVRRPNTFKHQLLFGVMCVVLVLGVGIVGIAAHLADRVEAFRHTRTAAYWAGVFCVVLYFFHLPAYYFMKKQPQQQSSKRLFVFSVVGISLAMVYLATASMVAIYYSSLIAATDSQNCVYFNGTGSISGPAKCASQCQIIFNKDHARKTCCCCKPGYPESEYNGIYMEGISSCPDLFGVVSDSVVALSAVNCATTFFLMFASILGCVLCCGCCDTQQSWSPAHQEIVLVPVDPTNRDKSPLLREDVIALDVPPPYTTN